MLLWGLGIWASLIEPRLLRERYFSVGGAPAHLPELRLALVSDLHWGLYFRESQFKRLVEQLNALDVDAIVIPGDWTYEPTTDLHTGLAPLATLNKPVFGVLGNHDLQAPGPNLALPLRAALEAHGVRLLEGQRLSWRGWEWVGLDDDWGGDPDPQIHHLWPTLTAPQQSPSSRLVVVHQPNTVSKLPRHAAFLSVAGHTHGGQIWLPGLTPRILQRMSPRGWWNGLYSTPAGHLFVTPGIGTIGLPARLGVMPTIDIVSLVHDNPMH
jgi:predicted MPP superfamily phosphohydrolase